MSFTDTDKTPTLALETPELHTALYYFPNLEQDLKTLHQRKLQLEKAVPDMDLNVLIDEYAKLLENKPTLAISNVGEKEIHMICFFRMVDTEMGVKAQYHSRVGGERGFYTDAPGSKEKAVSLLHCNKRLGYTQKAREVLVAAMALTLGLGMESMSPEQFQEMLECIPQLENCVESIVPEK
ncbi:hypothetical protein IT417_00360 [bacterium]|nr:hypothetical protein [bacterium]